MVQVQPEILATLLAIVGAVLGYAFREYRNRARPFFQLTELGGDLLKRSDQTQIEESLSHSLSSTFYIKGLDAKSTVGEVWDCWDRADDVERRWPEVRDKLDKILASTSDDALMYSFPDLFDLKYFERWMMLILVADRITFSKIPKQSVIRIKVFQSEDNKGSVWFAFPTKTVSFGNNFSEPAIGSKCTPFVNSIKYLHRDLIFSILRQYKDIMEEEHKAALSTIHDLKAISDAHSRWSFSSYFANLSSAPIVIENDGEVLVHDKTTKFKLRERCYLANLQLKEGKSSIVDTNKPIVIRGGADAEFVFITRKTQTEMTLGSHLRTVFESGTARVKVSFPIRKVGLLKRQRFVSPGFKFEETTH